jgi:cytochrome c553
MTQPFREEITVTHFRSWLCLLALAAAQSVTANEAVQAACGRCHGADGVATAPETPHLNGQQPGYLIDSMEAFKSKKRPTAVPEHQAATVSTELIRAAAELYAGSKAARPAQTTNPDKVAKGESIYGSKCAACHPDNGRDFEQDAPLMAAQNLAYLNAQNRLFVAGKRKFAFKQDEAFKGLSEADLEAVAEFFAAQEQVVAKATGKKKRAR